MDPKHERDYERYDEVELGFDEDGEALEDILMMYLTDEDIHRWGE